MRVMLFILCGYFTFAQPMYHAFADTPVGFASVQGAPTGGLGGRVVTVTSAAELLPLLDSDEKLIIQVSGTITLSGMVTMRSNKSLIGLGNNAKITGGGLELYKRNNVIMRNISFEDAQDDCIKLNQNTHHIWIDHCNFSDGAFFDSAASNHDGLLDITRQTTYITISYCIFEKHNKCILIGHSDGSSNDTGFLKVTLHHNWFKGTLSRHPRVRFGEVHCFNNYYENNGTYGIASTCEADLMVEGNYFVHNPFPSYCGYGDSPPGDLVERYNKYVNCGIPQTRGTAFLPSAHYPYTLDSAANVPAIVMNSAGVGKILTAVRQMEDTPVAFSLFQNYPNPFNPATVIRFAVTETSPVRLWVTDVLGNEVAVLANGVFTAGEYNRLFTAQNLPSGLYFYTLRSGRSISTKSMILIK